MSNQLDDYHQQIRLLRECTEVLTSLGSAFNRTGNEKVAEDLWQLAEHIEKAKVGIETFVAGELDERLKDSREMTRAVLGAALAGVHLGQAKAQP